MSIRSVIELPILYEIILYVDIYTFCNIDISKKCFDTLLHITQNEINLWKINVLTFEGGGVMCGHI